MRVVDLPCRGIVVGNRTALINSSVEICTFRTLGNSSLFVENVQISSILLLCNVSTGGCPGLGHITVHHRTVHHKAVHFIKVHKKTIRHITVQHHKRHVPKWYVTKRYSYIRVNVTK
jgi:hypothetical protein